MVFNVGSEGMKRKANWVRDSDLVGLVKRYRIIVITPNAGNSWYTNAPGRPDEAFEDAIIKDLLPHVDRALEMRNSRGVSACRCDTYRPG